MQYGTAKYRINRDIGQCDSVVSLHRVIGEWTERLDQIDQPWAKLGDLYDLTELPVFGGEVPEDTSGVWSWDKRNLLVGAGDLTVVARDIDEE